MTAPILRQPVHAAREAAGDVSEKSDAFSIGAHFFRNLFMLFSLESEGSRSKLPDISLQPVAGKTKSTYSGDLAP
jgi:hypothetical protein